MRRSASFGRLADPNRHSLVLGLIAGAVYFAGTLYWISGVLVSYGGLTPVLAVPVNALLVGYVALFPAVFALLLGLLARRLGRTALLLAPAVWVSTELARAHLFGGFPWVLLGYSQTSALPIAQTASLFGVYGISALVVAVNAVLALAVLEHGRKRAIAVAAALICVLVPAIWGALRVRANGLLEQGVPIRVGLVQGNVAQEDKWSPELREAIYETYLRMSREATDRDARLVIWPESSLPFHYEEDPEAAEEIRQLARASGAHVLIGSDEMDRGPPLQFFNSAFLVQPDGETAAVYRKIRLVPFGEYVPLRRLLFFVGTVVDAVADFSPGAEPVVMSIGEHAISTAICYEVVYADLMRQFVLEGSNLLTTITNDAWFGRSSAPYQHFEQAAMRAIEGGRYLVRAANTGISGLVDPYGRVLVTSELFEPAVMVGDVRLLAGETLYVRIGDLFAYLCVMLVAAAVLAANRGRAPARTIQRVRRTRAGKPAA